MWTRERPVADVEIGARSVTVCHLANIATWLGRKIQWDPSKEKIVGDAEASRWLDRPGERTRLDHRKRYPPTGSQCLLHRFLQ